MLSEVVGTVVVISKLKIPPSSRYGFRKEERGVQIDFVDLLYNIRVGVPPASRAVSGGGLFVVW